MAIFNSRLQVIPDFGTYSTEVRLPVVRGFF